MVQDDSAFVCSLPQIVLIVVRAATIKGQKHQFIHVDLDSCLLISPQMTVHHILHYLVLVQFYIVQAVIVYVDFLAGVWSVAHLDFNETILAIEIQRLIKHLIIAISTRIHIGLRLVKHD